jgi:hypothetical protein
MLIISHKNNKNSDIEKTEKEINNNNNNSKKQSILPSIELYIFD